MNKVGGPVISTRRVSGAERKRLHRAAARAEYVRIAPGYLVETQAYDDLDSEEQSLARVAAHADRVENGVVVGRSAALIHGLPVVDPPHLRDARRVEIAKPRGRALRTEHLQHRSLAGAHSRNQETVDTEFGSVQVSDVLTTCLDLARWATLEDAVRCLDHGLAAGLFTLEDVDRRVMELTQVEGIDQIRRAALLATGSSESPQESSLKVILWELGITPPLQQVVVYSRRRVKIGRVDFFFPDLSLIVEYDGKEKYTLNPGAADKEYRQTKEYLRNGLFVIRLTDADLDNGVAAEIIEEFYRPRATNALAYPEHLWVLEGEVAWRG
ncbi:MAG: hypothetical protein Q4G50_12910 [Corynebacterium sp.]|uniref:hypothetical protein n=1 Tax=Corynebacterium sp. TaxID=1720 RepID=UPI0026E0A3D5|nr:hypothetical protein [Corynebacterium sp.]MDO5670886.1 hypothetical protein [Corynebacterium sp.]